MPVRRSFIKLVFLCGMCLGPLHAQIELSGSADFEVAAGGEDSRFVTNEINNEFRRPHLSIRELNLFLFSEIGGDFFFNARLQWDIWGSGRLNPLRITLASLSWEPEEGQVALSVGRFVNPFGLYPRRKLSSESSFINAPLAYGYFINVSDTRGFWPAAGKAGQYGSEDVGLTMNYFGGYATGALFNWVIIPEGLDLALAVTNAAPASQQDYTNLQNLGATLRLGFQPAIFWQQGISVSHGSFMRREAVNNNFDRLEQYRQTLLGTDIIIAYAYFELSGELLYALWDVPASDKNGFQIGPDGNLQAYRLSNWSAYVDTRFELPFLPGSYVAGRYERMVFDRFTPPPGSSLTATNPWDESLIRYSFALGYRLARPVLLKFAFSEQIYDDRNLKRDDWTMRLLLNVSL